MASIFKNGKNQDISKNVGTILMKFGTVMHLHPPDAISQ